MLKFTGQDTSYTIKKEAYGENYKELFEELCERGVFTYDTVEEAFCERLLTKEQLEQLDITTDGIGNREYYETLLETELVNEEFIEEDYENAIKYGNGECYYRTVEEV